MGVPQHPRDGLIPGSGCPLLPFALGVPSLLGLSSKDPEPTRLETQLEQRCWAGSRLGALGAALVLQDGGVVGLGPGRTPSTGPFPPHRPGS